MADSGLILFASMGEDMPIICFFSTKIRFNKIVVTQPWEINI